MSRMLIAVVLAAAAPSAVMALGQGVLLSRVMSTSPSSSPSSRSEGVGRIDVNGEAIIAVTPDRATMAFQVQVTDRDKLEAQRRIDEATARVLQALRSGGATPAQLTSTAMQLQPVYARDRRGNVLYLQIEAWQATRSVTACAHTLEAVTPWQDAARAAGAVTIGEVALEASTLQALKEEARLKAATAARAKGLALVEALGGRLGAPLSISENASSTTDPATYKRANVADSRVEGSVVSGDFAAGTMSVVATVAVTFEVLSGA